jgi:hypothetical protein
VDSLTLPGWLVEFDRETTIAIHAQIPSGGPEICGCDPCRNWVQTRDRLFPEELLALLKKVGVPFDHEVEVYHNCRLPTGLHSYCGWYHFVGRTISGERECSPNIVFGPFSFYFHSGAALLNKVFADQPVVSLEFAAEVPWLSSIAETK